VKDRLYRLFKTFYNFDLKDCWSTYAVIKIAVLGRIYVMLGGGFAAESGQLPTA
jgi:hypothetical protein